MNIIKIILLGDSGVGKSRICHRYTGNKLEFNENITIGVEFNFKHYLEDDVLYNIHIWDTAGQEKFRSIIRSYYRRNNSNIIVFDITNIDSILNISLWLDDLEKNSDNKIIFLIANKIDLYTETVDTEKQIQQILLNKHIKGLYKVSALTGENLNESLDDIIKQTIFYSDDLYEIKLNSSGSVNLLEDDRNVNTNFSKKHCC